MSKPDEAGNATASQETTKAEGQPDGELKAEGGESTAKAQETEGLEKSYKELQSKFSKTTEELKANKEKLDKLNAYGGVEKIVEQIEYLAGNEDFKEWAKQQSQKNDYGINPSETDAETQQALKLVEKIASATTEKQVQKAVAELKKELQDQINPVSTEYAAEKMDSLLDGLDEKYGEGWHEVKDQMADIIEQDKSFPKIPTAKAVEGALVKALIQEGKMDEFGKNLYEKSLEAKKDMATETLGTRKDATTDTKPKTIQEAYEQAKRQHNYQYQ
jgi:hypothetical protein